jgi:hypothetical protein
MAGPGGVLALDNHGAPVLSVAETTTPTATNGVAAVTNSVVEGQAPVAPGTREVWGVLVGQNTGARVGL